MAAVRNNTFLQVTLEYLGTPTGLKNLVAKPVCYYEQFLSMTGGTPSQSLFPAHMKVVKAFISASEALTSKKTAWMYKLAQGESSQMILKEAADWTMCAYDFLVYAHTAKIVVVAKDTLFKGLCVFNIASVVYCVISIKDELAAYQRVMRGAHHEDQQVLGVKRNAMLLGCAISVSYIALTVFSLPALLNLSMAVRYANRLRAAQWLCQVSATTASVVQNYYVKMYLQPAPRRPVGE